MNKSRTKIKPANAARIASLLNFFVLFVLYSFPPIPPVGSEEILREAGERIYQGDGLGELAFIFHP